LKLQVLADLTPVQLTILYQDLHPIVQAQDTGSVTPSWTAAVLTEWYLVNSESGQMTGIISLAWYTGACIYLFLIALIRSGGKHKFNFSSIRFSSSFFCVKLIFLFTRLPSLIGSEIAIIMIQSKHTVFSLIYARLTCSRNQYQFYIAPTPVKALPYCHFLY